MNLALLVNARAQEVLDGAVAFFTNFGVIQAIEILFFFAIIFFVSKVLRDNGATKLMVVYWIMILLGGTLHLAEEKIIDQQFFLLYIVLLSALMLIIFSSELKKYFWDVQKSKDKTSEKSTGNGVEVHTPADTERSIQAIVKALQNMSKNNVGALIVLSKGSLPRQVVQSGITIDSEISTQMLEGIFFPKAPLHDGATIIHGHRIQSAGCFLPLTQKTSYPKEFGTRHRAAIGITEVANVISLVVSEETGIISIVKQGNVIRYADSDMLTDALKDYYWQEMPLTERRRNPGGNK